MAKKSKARYDTTLRRKTSSEWKREEARDKKARKRKKETLSDEIAEKGFAKKHIPLLDNIKNGGSWFPVKDYVYLEKIVLYLIEKKARFVTVHNSDILKTIANQYSDGHIRPFDTWQPKSKSKKGQLRSFIDHLFVKYPVPSFLYSCFENPLEMDGRQYRYHFPWMEIFRGLAKGDSRHKKIPTLLGFKLTKKQVNIFLAAKANASPLAALRKGQILALIQEGEHQWGEALYGALMGTRWGQNKQRNNESRWADALHWFVNQKKDLSKDLSVIGPLVDYIHHVWVDNPNWKLKGRRVAPMLMAMHHWHRELSFAKSFKGKTFHPSGFSPKRWEVKHLENSDFRWVYLIEEILNIKELANEGNEQKHCVLSYAKDITNRTISIWVLRRKLHKLVTITDPNLNKEVKALTPIKAGFERLLTIEVKNTSKEIYQVRGKMNRRGTKTELSFVQKWASSEALRLSRWV